MGGSPTSLWREHAPKNTLNLKNRTSLANKATVSVSLLSEFGQLVRFPKEQDRISNHSFTHLAVARWQDWMSRGKKS